MAMYNIGDIVGLNTHPFFAGHTEIILAGDPMQQSPLMVITEEKRVISKAGNGEKEKDAIATQYRCYWYSAKSQRFEFSWFPMEQLKLIETVAVDVDCIPAIGAAVIFRTARLEVQKKKGTMQYGIGIGTNDAFGISSLMSFVSPVLLVTGYVESNAQISKKKEIEQATSPPMLKVKWFNLPADKFSESVIPLICIDELPIVDLATIETIEKCISNREFLKVDIDDEITIINPLLISFLNGVYFLRYFNILSGRAFNGVPVNGIKILASLKQVYKERAPVFDFTKSGKPKLYSADLIKSSLGKTIRIKYTNLQQTISVRCVKDFSIFEVEEEDGKVEYLQGFCLLKNAIRYFRLSRIEWVEVIDL